MRRFFIKGLVCSVLVAVSALSLGAEIRWLETEYDFGSFHEAGGLTSGEARFVNDGPEPTMINRVRLTCGCTSEVHTEGIINPGDTARVRFTYNPAGRPGRFEKSIKVYTGENNDLTTIRMRGTVIGTPATLQRDYPFEAGPIRLNSKKIDFGKVRYGTSRHQFLVLYNQGSDPIAPTWSDPGNAVSVDLSEKVIPPGDLATMSIYLNTRDEEREEMMSGPVSYQFSIFPDKNADPDIKIEINLLADIQPEAQDLTPEQLEAAPRAECSPRLLDLGIVSLAVDKKVATFPISFTLANVGKEMMHVKRIFSRGVPLKVKRYPASLKGGKEGKVETTVDFRKFPQGPFSFKIEVLTDDPLHPVRTVTVSGEVTK